MDRYNIALNQYVEFGYEHSMLTSLTPNASIEHFDDTIDTSLLPKNNERIQKRVGFSLNVT